MSWCSLKVSIIHMIHRKFLTINDVSPNDCNQSHCMYQGPSQSLGTGSVGDNLLGSFWIVCGGVTIIVMASLLSPCPRCAETGRLLQNKELLAGQIKPSFPRLWTCVDTGQYFAVLESHSVIKQGLEHLKDTACLHWTLSRCGNAFCVSTQCADHLLGKQKHNSYTPVRQ